MKDSDQLKKLKTRYVDLMRRYGKQVAEYDAFRQALLELNRKHRQDALRMYSRIILRIERKALATKRAGSGIR